MNFNRSNFDGIELRNRKDDVSAYSEVFPTIGLRGQIFWAKIPNFLGL